MEQYSSFPFLFQQQQGLRRRRMRVNQEVCPFRTKQDIKDMIFSVD